MTTSNLPTPFFLEDALGIAPSGLQFCFDRECFLDPTFSSIEFILTQDRREISLETSRDSLLQYSNILKSCLVELINQDYADFVNLSTNLVDLDKGIDSISSPLESLRTSVLELITELSTTENHLSTKLHERQQLREKKDLLSSLYSVDQCIDRLERWLKQDVTKPAWKSSHDRPSFSHATAFSSDKPSGSDLRGFEIDLTIWPPDFYTDCSLQEDPGLRIERVASEYGRLQFFSKRCQNHPLVQSMRPRIHWITSTLMEQLEIWLQKSLDAAQLTSTNKSPVISKAYGEQLRQAVSTYLMIDRSPDVVQLYRRHVLRPKLGKVFISRSELSCSGSDVEKASAALNEMYTEALAILDHQLEVFRQLSSQRAPDSYDPLAEFDYLVDGFWPETVELLIHNAPDIFTSGYPDRFHKLYNESQIFLNQLESRLETAGRIRNFRGHPAYSQFSSKWSLPVYFQIRFQDIAGTIETAMHIGLNSASSDTLDCRLHVTAVLIEQLERCWMDGIYLNSLRHRFLKLTLQLFNRYASFAQSQIDNLLAKQDPAAFTENVDKLVSLLIDCHHLSAHARNKLPKVILAALGSVPNAGASSRTVCPAMLKDCLDECARRLVSVVAPLSDAVLELVKPSCLETSRQISDIPRQYRRTNRAYPSAPSNYVTNLISPIIHLTGSNAGIKDDSTSEALEKLTQTCIEQVANVFLKQLVDVLNSVKKTEESLRKLREARRASSAISDQIPNTGDVCLDEDKIRHQLYLDACYFRDQVDVLCGTSEETRKKLNEIVQLTRTSKTDASLNGQ